MLIKQTIRRQANISKGHTPYCDCNSSIRFARIAANSSSAILIRGELLATKPSIYCRVTWPTCVQLSLPVAGFARANRANRRAPWSSKGRVGGDRDRDRHSVHSPQVHTFYYIQDRYSVDNPQVLMHTYSLTDGVLIINPLTPGAFCQKCVFWTFW